MIIFRIKEILEQKNISILKLSELTKISRSALYPIINNEPRSFKIEYLNRIAKELNVSESELFTVINDFGTDIKLLSAVSFTFNEIFCKVSTNEKAINGLLTINFKKIKDRVLVKISINENAITELLEKNLLTYSLQIVNDSNFSQKQFINEVSNRDTQLLKKNAKDFIDSFFTKDEKLKILLNYELENTHLVIDFLNRFTFDCTKKDNKLTINKTIINELPKENIIYF